MLTNAAPTAHTINAEEGLTVLKFEDWIGSGVPDVIDVSCVGPDGVEQVLCLRTCFCFEDSAIYDDDAKAPEKWFVFTNGMLRRAPEGATHHGLMEELCPNVPKPRFIG